MVWIALASLKSWSFWKLCTCCALVFELAGAVAEFPEGAPECAGVAEGRVALSFLKDNLQFAKTVL